LTKLYTGHTNKGVFLQLLYSGMGSCLLLEPDASFLGVRDAQCNQPLQHHPISKQLRLNKPVLFLSFNSH